jgi:hypothetical protein
LVKFRQVRSALTRVRVRFTRIWRTVGNPPRGISCLLQQCSKEHMGGRHTILPFPGIRYGIRWGLAKGRVGEGWTVHPARVKARSGLPGGRREWSSAVIFGQKREQTDAYVQVLSFVRRSGIVPEQPGCTAVNGKPGRKIRNPGALHVPDAASQGNSPPLPRLCEARHGGY